MGPANSPRITRVPGYSGVSLAIFEFFVYVTITLYGIAFQLILLNSLITLLKDPITPQMPKHLRFGLIPVRSPLLRESLLFSFPMGT